jgi:rod shape-determining protein MreD
MRVRTLILVSLAIVIAVVVQTTLFGQLELITPDLVMLVSIMLSLTRIRSEIVLGLAFLSGLIVDLLGSSLLGLRAIVFTAVAYIAVRTTERAEVGRLATALWVGALTLVGVVLLILVGTIFGQTSLLGDGALTHVVFVPLTNLAIAALLAPLFVRLIDHDATAFRYS